MSSILGLSFGFHDSSASIIIDGKFIVGSDEERFSRVKHDQAFPINAINFCLQETNLTIDDIDTVVYYEDNLLKLDRIINSSLTNEDENYFETVLKSWTLRDIFNIEAFISEKLNLPIEKIKKIEHHLSHASVAYLPSGFDTATILVMDGVGEYDTLSIYKGEQNNITKIKSITLPNSVGLLYSAFTSFLGFEVNEGEYKVMGMGAYGKPLYVDLVKQVLTINDDGSFEIDNSYFNFLTPKHIMYTDKFLEIFKQPRDTSKDFFTHKFIDYAPTNLSPIEKENLANENEYYANLASSIQRVTEEIIFKTINNAIKLTGYKNLCLAGGVALNSLANGKIRENTNVSSIFIQPASGDGGSSLGCGLYYANSILGEPRYSFDSAYRGKQYTQDEIYKQIKSNTLTEPLKIDDIEEYTSFIVDKLIKNSVIGWVYGRFEWGPRSLGARSILAIPSSLAMKDIVNEKIKFRELFRPFAPAVLAQDAIEWFDIDPLDIQKNSPESYMLSVAQVKQDKKDLVPAIVHADGSARVQLVWEDTNPMFYALLKKMKEKTGIPILLNTSFNLKGEPIVNSPKDAIMTFGYCNMDYLCMYPYIIKSKWSKIL